MDSNETPSMTIFTFCNEPHSNEIINEQPADLDPSIVEHEESTNIMCIIFKGGKLGSAYYNVEDKMVCTFSVYSKRCNCS